ncbi:MAG: hypothetical protein KA715_04535 [Xanthomonadaceae bacterium]|nr:hypothetical protein [Xanthomonadaceae bacterium]
MSSHSHAGVISKNHLWQKNRLKVCFAQKLKDLKDVKLPVNLESLSKTFTPFPDNIADLAIEAVKESFSIPLTAVEFYGFQDCGRHSDFDVALVYLDEPEALLTAGSIGDPHSKTSILIRSGFIDFFRKDWQLFQGFLIQNELSNKSAFQNGDAFSNDVLKRAIVHEFGHVLGLFHEHSRQDVPRFARLPLFDDFSKNIERMHLDLENSSYSSHEVSHFNINATMGYYWFTFMRLKLRLDAICSSSISFDDNRFHSFLNDFAGKLLFLDPKQYKNIFSQRSFDSRALCTTIEPILNLFTHHGDSLYLEGSDIEALKFGYLGDTTESAPSRPSQNLNELNEIFFESVSSYIQLFSI